MPGPLTLKELDRLQVLTRIAERRLTLHPAGGAVASNESESHAEDASNRHAGGGRRKPPRVRHDGTSEADEGPKKSRFSHRAPHVEPDSANLPMARILGDGLLG